MHMRATGPVTYTGHDAIAADIAHLGEATAGSGAEEVFMTAISPTNVEGWQENAFYDTQEEFLYAIGEAMREEYLAIVDAGFLLQIDDPGLLTQYAMHADWSVDDTRAWARTRVEALNHALRGIPPERVRFHTCYSINMGPRVHDMELRDIVDLVLEIDAGAYSFEAANPRHEHEWRVWEDAGLPDDKIIIPGVVTPLDRPGRAPRHGRRADREVRERRRPGARHRGLGLRLRLLRDHRRARPAHRVGEARGAGGGRAPGERCALVVPVRRPFVGVSPEPLH